VVRGVRQRSGATLLRITTPVPAAVKPSSASHQALTPVNGSSPADASCVVAGASVATGVVGVPDWALGALPVSSSPLTAVAGVVVGVGVSPLPVTGETAPGVTIGAGAGVETGVGAGVTAGVTAGVGAGVAMGVVQLALGAGAGTGAGAPGEPGAFASLQTGRAATSHGVPPGVVPGTGVAPGMLPAFGVQTGAGVQLSVGMPPGVVDGVLVGD
jgi:hypothetical protein